MMMMPSTAEMVPAGYPMQQMMAMQGLRMGMNQQQMQGLGMGMNQQQMMALQGMGMGMTPLQMMALHGHGHGHGHEPRMPLRILRRPQAPQNPPPMQLVQQGLHQQLANSIRARFLANSQQHPRPVQEANEYGGDDQGDEWYQV